MSSQHSTPRTPSPGRKRPNTPGMIALVLALKAVLAACTLWFIPLAALLGVAAVICGVVGCVKVRRGTADELLPAIIGLVVGLIAATACIGMTVMFLDSMSHLDARPSPPAGVSAAG
ncbi:hypothetical protein ACSNOK_10705 [Streptomyces sp. URMC 126]|uniref:hypothetical protein n=1 Tax=Streptomyces sp. URMC 126 TaxID=3423401 RepID=UPI003F19BB64